MWCPGGEGPDDCSDYQDMRVCNVLEAIKTAKLYTFGKHDLIVTIYTDGIDRDYAALEQTDETRAVVQLSGIFYMEKLVWIKQRQLRHPKPMGQPKTLHLRGATAEQHRRTARAERSTGLAQAPQA